jgi:hypothetical protein
MMAMYFMGLPLTNTEDICFRLPLAVFKETACGYRGLEDIMGTLPVNSDVFDPGEKQCESLIRAYWPFLTYWFNRFYPSPFNPPILRSPKIMVEAFLKLYILQFTPASIEKDPDWTTILNAINAPGENWKNYLVWGGEDAAYTIDRGITTLPLPKDLKAWIAGCVYPPCIDLLVININTTVCDEADCPMKEKCKTISPMMTCSLD